MDKLLNMIKNNIILFGITIMIIGYFIVSHFEQAQINSDMNNQSFQLIEETETTVSHSIVTSIMDIYVDIKGEVNRPGMYRLTKGSRLLDAIELAGGITDLANMNSVNQSLLLTDQMMIVIPRIDVDSNYDQSDNFFAEEFSIITPISEDFQEKININVANAQELLQLPGIGPKKAEAIINYRKEIGSFQTLEDLKNVAGIGSKTFEQLKDLITVDR